MSRQNIEEIRKEASSKSINKWATRISKEVGIKNVKRGSPTERMSYVIAQLKRRKNIGRGKLEKASKKLRKKWKEKD